MIQLNNFIKFIVYSNLYVAFSVFCLVKVTDLLLGIEDYSVALFSFFSTVFVYNFMRMHQQATLFKKRNSPLYKWIDQYKIMLYVLANVSLVVAIFIAVKYFPKTIFYAIFPLAILSLLYPIRIVKIKGKRKRLRELPLIKIFLITMTWSLVTVLLPVLKSTVNLDLDIVLLIVERFLFVLVITIPFDIRDMKYDAIDMQTIPQLFGEKKSKLIALVLLFLFQTLIILQFYIGEILNVNLLIAFLLTSILTGIIVFFASKERKETYYTILVEGTSILMYLLILIFL